MTALSSDAARTGVGTRRRGHGIGVVVVWELEKLAAQLRVRIAFAVCLLGPFAFAGGLTFTGTVPADTLFGRWVDDSGFAVPLVVLGFAASWGFPALAAVVAGDIFSAEDQLGTWPTLLTRSVGRGAFFAGKVLATAVYVLAILGVLAAASLAAGVVVEGRRSLIGLSGNLLPAGRATELVLAAWATTVLPCLGFAAVAVLISVLTRNSLAAIIGTVSLGLAMQFGGLIDGIQPVREAMLGTQFLAWHGLFADPAFRGPVTASVLVSLAYLVPCLSATWYVQRRRDNTGS